jgi:hypothetical protein
VHIAIRNENHKIYIIHDKTNDINSIEQSSLVRSAHSYVLGLAIVLLSGILT